MNSDSPKRWMPSDTTRNRKEEITKLVADAVKAETAPVTPSAPLPKNYRMRKVAKNEFGVTFDVPEQTFHEPQNSQSPIALKTSVSPWVFRTLKSQEEGVAEIIERLVREHFKPKT